MRALTFFYGVVCYLVFLGSFLYAVGFVGNLVVPKAIDTGPAGPAGPALLVDVILLGLFAVQHSVMARQGFKQWWTRFVPRPVERSTYVLVSSLLLLLLFWKWQPILGVVWSVESRAGALVLQALFWLGWATVLLSSFMTNHFDLFGLRQVYLRLRGADYTSLPFSKMALYKLVRHPIMLGFLIAFWAAPTMTLGHLLFAVATTGYIFAGVLLEEKDLVAYHGQAYEQYRKEVSMLLPIPRRGR